MRVLYGFVRTELADSIDNPEVREQIRRSGDEFAISALAAYGMGPGGSVFGPTAPELAAGGRRQRMRIGIMAAETAATRPWANWLISSAGRPVTGSRRCGCRTSSGSTH